MKWGKKEEKTKDRRGAEFDTLLVSVAFEASYGPTFPLLCLLLAIMIPKGSGILVMMSPFQEGIYLNVEAWAWLEHYGTHLFLSLSFWQKKIPDDQICLLVIFLFFYYFFDWGDKRSQFYVPFLSVLDEQLINRPSWRQKRKQQRRESKWPRYRTHIALVELKVLLVDFWTPKFWPLVLGWHRRRNPEFKLQPPH